MPFATPFRFGPVTVNEAVQLFVHLGIEVDGKCSDGASAELMVPKWFNKDPKLSATRPSNSFGSRPRLPGRFISAIIRWKRRSAFTPPASVRRSQPAAKPASRHWPPRSARRKSTRPSSMRFCAPRTQTFSRACAAMSPASTNG
jgi:hypothetical protein